jgi:hypothetical protein
MTTSNKSFTSDDLYVKHIPTLEIVLDGKEKQGNEEMNTIEVYQ